jgi:hypothetical protein
MRALAGGAAFEQNLARRVPDCIRGGAKGALQAKLTFTVAQFAVAGIAAQSTPLRSSEAICWAVRMDWAAP